MIWLAEFQPGVPWKGIQSGGESKADPYMAPGSVLGSPGTSSLNDPDHQLLRDNIGRRVDWLSSLRLFFKVNCTKGQKESKKDLMI